MATSSVLRGLLAGVVALTVLVGAAMAQETTGETTTDIPPDVDMALLAVVAALRHAPDTAPPQVDFAPGVAAALAEDGFSYQGFQLADVQDLAVEGIDTPSGQVRRLTGGMLFVDGVQRRAVAAFAVDYRPAAGDGILVVDGATDVVAPAEPRIALYLLPVSAVPEDATSVAPDQLRLMDWLSPAALCFGSEDPGLSETAKAMTDEFALIPGQTSEDGRLTVSTARCLGSCGLAPVAVFMDRLPKEALAFFAVTGGPGEDRSRPPTQVVDYGGWRMLMAHDALDAGLGPNARLEVLVQPTLGGKPSGAARAVLDWRLADFLPRR